MIILAETPINIEYFCCFKGITESRRYIEWPIENAPEEFWQGKSEKSQLCL